MFLTERVEEEEVVEGEEVEKEGSRRSLVAMVARRKQD